MKRPRGQNIRYATGVWINGLPALGRGSILTGWSATPCCRRSIPTPIIGIAADEHDGPEALLGLIVQAGLKIPILLVPTTDIEAMEKHYDHKILPATYVIDKQGWVRSVFEGLTPMERLKEALADHPTE